MIPPGPATLAAIAGGSPASFGFRVLLTNGTTGLPESAITSRVRVSYGDLEGAGSAEAEVLDPAQRTESAVNVSVDAGYSGELLPLFRGEILSGSRDFVETPDGDDVPLRCVGEWVRILDREVDTPMFEPGYPGVGGWHDAAYGVGSNWTRAHMIEDLARLYFPAFPRDISPTTTVAVQRPWIGVQLGEALSRIALPEFGFVGMDTQGRIIFRPTDEDEPASPDHVFAQDRNLLSVRPEHLREQLVNRVLVIGESDDRVRIVKPTDLLAVDSFSLQANTTVTRVADLPTQAIVDANLTNSVSVEVPSFTPVTKEQIVQTTVGSGADTGTVLQLTSTTGQPLSVVDGFVMNVAHFETQSPPNPNPGGLFTVRFTYEDATTQDFCPNGNCHSCALTPCPGPIAFVSPCANLTPIPFNAPKPVTEVRVFTSGFLGRTYTTRFNYTYTQRADASPPSDVTITERTDAFPPPNLPPETPAPPYNLTTFYPFDAQSTFPTTNVNVTVEIYGRAVSDEKLPVVYLNEADETAAALFGDREITIESESIRSQAEAQAIASRLLAAGRSRGFVWSFEIPGNPTVERGDSVRLDFTSGNWLAKLGPSSPTLYVTGVEHDIQYGEEIGWVTRVTAVEWVRTPLAVARSLGQNIIKDRGDAQSRWLSGSHVAAIVAVENPSPQIPGEPDRQRYTVVFLTRNNLEVENVPNASDRPFAVGEMAYVTFRQGSREQPYLLGPVDKAFLESGVETIPA